LTPSIEPSQSSPETLRQIASGFESRDWICCPGFLPGPRVEALRHESTALHGAGKFHAAGIGRGALRDAAVRGDEVLWFEDDLTWAPEAARLLSGEFSALRDAINAATFLGLQDFEGHYAVYAPGARYARHVDRFKHDSRRVVSVVLYLNDAWEAEDGGELCLYRDPADAEPAGRVLPEAGTLVCFLSATLPHEVREARRARMSLTGWFRRRP
jgi:SM-20-related protein